MFNKNYFPTPQRLIDKMIDKLKNWEAHLYILEPSSGKGDIIERYQKRLENKLYRKENIIDYKFDAIEIDFNLQSILKNKDIRLVHDDFLTFAPSRYYDVIIMNPPFDVGASHLLKAIELQERIGGQISCLLNSETIKNPYSNNRRLLQQKLTQYNADVEFLQEAFSDAERKTNVETVLVYVNVPMKEKESLFESEYNRTESVTFKAQNMGLIPQMNKGQKLVFECDLIKKSGVKLFEEQKRIQNLLESFDLKNKLSITDERYGQKSINHNEFINSINQEYWKKFINETDIASKLPSKLRNEFMAMIDKQQDIDFTVFNVKMFTHELMQSIAPMYEKGVSEVFDTLTQKYHYSDNAYSKSVYLYNGWKTNNAFKIVKKVIVPCKNYSWGSNDIPDVLRDLNIIFQNISGINDDIITDKYLRQGVEQYEKGIETEFFTIDSYKKGTIHIKFNNEDYLKQFNMLAGKGKNWLPHDFGEKEYNDMSQEEKQTCNDFGLSEEDYTRLATPSNQYLRLM